MEVLSIGQVARQAGLTVEAVRFYEKRRLIEPPPRSESGYRQYPANAVRRLKFIQRAKEAGFTLRDIGDLLALRQEPGASCADVKLRATHKVEEVERKIRDLECIRDALATLILRCSGSADLSECPILEALEWEEGDAS